MSTTSRVTSHECPGAAPISTGDSAAGDLFVVMTSPALSDRNARLFGRSGDTFDKVIHRLDRRERKLLSFGAYHRAILLGDRSGPNELFACDDIGLGSEHLGLDIRRHCHAERI